MRKFWKFLAGLGALLAAAYYVLVTVVAPGYIRQALPVAEALAEQYIEGSVQIGSLIWHGGLTAELGEVTVKNRDGVLVAELPRTLVSLRPWLALGNAPARAVSGIELVQPRIYLHMEEDGRWNLQHFLKASDSEERPFYGLLRVSGGILNVEMPCGSWDFGVEGSVNGGANPNFAIDASVIAGEDRVKVQGLLTPQAVGSLSVQADRLLLAPYAGLAEQYITLRQLDGEVGKLHLNWRNNGNRVQISGEGVLRRAGGILLDGEREIAISNGGGSFAASGSMLTVQTLDADVNGHRLHLEGEADLTDIKKPKGRGVVSAASLQWGEWQVKDVRLPFTFEGSGIVWRDAALSYGGGTISSDGLGDFEEKAVSAVLKLEHVAQNLPGKFAGQALLNGELGLLVRSSGAGLKLQAAANTMDLKWRSIMVNSMALDGEFDGERLHVQHFSAFSDTGSLAASGTVALDGALHLQGRMSEFPINAFLQALGQEGSGLCSMGFNLGGTLAAPEFSGMVQLLAVEYMQQKIKEAHGIMSLKNNVLAFHNFGYEMEQGRHILNGTIDFNAAEPVMALDVETKGVRAEPLVAMAAPNVKLTGNVDNTFKLSGTPTHPYVYGDICLTYGSIDGYLLDKVQGRYAYEDGRLALSDFVINALSTEVYLEGVMDREQRLNFSMDARNISMERMPIMEKDLDIDGYVNAKGQLTGTLQQPSFSGSVSSAKLSVNGGVLTDLAGSLECNGREYNKLTASFRQPHQGGSNYGLFDASLNLDLNQHFLSGRIAAARGELGAILKMCRQEYDIDGIVQGSVEINPQGKGSGVNIRIVTEKGRVHDVDYYRMDLDGHIIDKTLYFDNCKLRERDNDQDAGTITLSGRVDFADRFLDVGMTAVQANPAIVTALMSDPTQLAGKMDMLLKVRGSFDNPAGSGSLSITSGSVAGVDIDRLEAELSLQNDSINLKRMLAAREAYNVRASGDIPLDLFRERQARRNPRAQMNIALDLTEARLGMLPAMTKMVEWGTGDTQGEVVISGTLEAPLLNGYIKIDEGSVKLKDVHTVLDKIHTDIEFQGNKIILHDLSAQLGKGRVALQGSYALRANAGETYKLHILAENAELASNFFTGRLNGEIDIVPQGYFNFRAHRGNTPPPRLYRPHITGALMLDDVLVNMPTIPELGEGNANLGLDLRVALGPKIHFFNKYLYDMWLGGSVHLKGSTVHPVMEGQIRAERGSVTYLRTHFKLTSAYAAWSVPGTFLPTVTMEGEARFSRYNVYMRINGPVDEMELKLTSNPPLEQNTIIRMLTLQREMTENNEVTNEDMQNLMAVGLQMTVLGNVEMMVKQTLGLDQFRIYNGRVRTGVGFENVKNHGDELTSDERNQYNMLVSKYLTRHIMVGYTSSFDGIDRSVFGQYDINRHISFTYSHSYYSYGKTDNWYGLEYRTTFN